MTETKTAPGLPARVFVVHPTDRSRVVEIRRGESGFYPLLHLKSEAEALEVADRLNRENGGAITGAQAEAMVAGSMFGWNVPGGGPRDVQRGRDGPPDQGV